VPSALHDLLVQLLSRRPELLLELAMRVGVEFPVADEVSELSADLSTLVSTELRADLVLELRDAVGKTLMAIVVEVQLGRDPDKRYTWPMYSVSLRHRMRCPVVLVVVALDAAVARWAAQPIELGPGNHYRPVVIGPDLVPIVTDVEWARKEPERSVLSALAHLGNLEAAWAAIVAVNDLADERLLVCVDTILDAVGPEAAQRLREIDMPIQNYEWKSEFAKKYVGEGKAEGKAEGLAEGRTKSLLTVLEARGFAVDDALERRILAETDLDLLDGWIRRAAVAATLDEVFE
jgi:hypothetical protein